jgi:hypothetical protein
MSEPTKDDLTDLYVIVKAEATALKALRDEIRADSTMGIAKASKDAANRISAVLEAEFKNVSQKNGVELNAAAKAATAAAESMQVVRFVPLILVFLIGLVSGMLLMFWLKNDSNQVISRLETVLSNQTSIYNAITGRKTPQKNGTR